MARLPKRYVDFSETDPAVSRAHAALGEAVQAAGPLDERARALVRLGIAIGAWTEGAVHSQVRKALDAGLEPEEIRHAGLLAIPILGFPSAQAALSWIEDLAGGPRRQRRPARAVEAKAPRRR